jgi:hypothetical protein
MIMHHETLVLLETTNVTLDKAFQFMNDNGYEAVKVVTLDPFYLLANTITANRSSIITNM